MGIRKRAFTLVELAIMLSIVGVLLILALGIVKSVANQYGAPYYNAYNSLKKAAYNVLADMYKPVSQVRPFPTTSNQLCERLIEFINTSAAPTCTNADVNANADNIGSTTLRFIGSNAFRYYISAKQTNITISGKTVEWFVIYVDINGEKGPNSVQKVRNSMPDIIPFAITTRGEIIPMGYPTISTKYMTAKIKYPNAYNATTGQLIEDRYSPSTSYFDARAKAWGTTQTVDIVETIDFTSRLSANNLARKFYSNPTASAVQTSVILPDGYRAGCAAGEYNCRVIVDSFVGRRF